MSKPIMQLGTPVQLSQKRKQTSPTVDLTECKEPSDARVEVEEMNDLTESGVPREHKQTKRKRMHADSSGDCAEELTASVLQGSLVGSLVGTHGAKAVFLVESLLSE